MYSYQGYKAMRTMTQYKTPVETLNFRYIKRNVNHVRKATS